ncbi:MAG: hypothetical protein INH05_21280 [Burkholderiales bacterium]|nr:hypothetical protein [Burkholderiales bacterium]
MGRSRSRSTGRFRRATRCSPAARRVSRRGFAVVAGEARTLAQHSADAARQIKAPIDDSVTRVATGTGLVDQAGGTMQAIVESVRRVDGIDAESATASRQQAAGVAHVGDTVVQIDQATQPNAAPVERSAVAADSMRDQARLLAEAVSVFRVPA